MQHEISTVLSGQAYLEGPRWHDNRVWVADFYLHQVLSAAEDGTDVRIEAEVPQQPSGLGWLPDGRLLIVSMRDRRVLRREDDGSLVVHADLGDYADGLANDMVVDAHGRAYVGNFGFDLMTGAAIKSTVLLRVDPDGTVTPVADDLWFPNGTVITDDGVLLVDETFGNRVTAFDVTSDGGLVNRRIWAEFAALPTSWDLAEALPQLVVAADGCGLDAEGALWIADAAHARVIRVRQGGEIVDEISLGQGVFACTLGGADGRTLFMCCAPDFNEQARTAARDGQLLSTRVTVPHGGRP